MRAVKIESGHVRMDRENYVCGYVASCRNQYVLDGVIYCMAGEDIEQFHGIPRPAKWINGKLKNIVAIKYLAHLLGLLWKYLGFYCFLLGQFAFSFFRANPKKTGSFVCDQESLAVVASQREENVIHQACAASPKIWFFVPWKKKSVQLKSNLGRIAECVPCLEKKDLIFAFFMAVAAHKKVGAQKNQNLIMQTYTAFFWMCALLALEKLRPKNIITASHHDRWAVLIDCYASDKNVNVRLVQHGIEHEKTYEIISNFVGGGQLPYRLKRVSEMFVYNTAQSNLFLRQIISTDADSFVPKITYFVPSLQLTSVGEPGATKVLFIGHPLCEELQSDIYLSVHKNFAFEFYYKPHPTVKAARSMYSVGWNFIENSDFFPVVDVLISYDSTLIKEYETLGVTSVIMHPMVTTSTEEFQGILQRVVSELEKFG